MSSPSVQKQSVPSPSASPRPRRRPSIDPLSATSPSLGGTMLLSETSKSSAGPTTVEEGVKVICRVRPFNQREIELHAKANEGKPAWEQWPVRSVVEFNRTRCSFLDHDNDWVEKEKFTFDACLWSIPPAMQESPNPFATQQDLFDQYGTQILAQAWKGFNTSFLAYGQTASGKTYSMMGDEDPRSAERGLIPRICQELFVQIDALRQQAERDSESGLVRTFKVVVQYLELYNEAVKDLLWSRTQLAPEVQAKVSHENLKIRHNPTTGVFVEHLTAVAVDSWQQMVQLIELGNSARATASTRMNERSSRSHAVFKVGLTQITTSIPKKQFEKPTEHIRESVINCVDLAGSERNKKTGATGDRLKEAASINKSLSTMKSVIDALVENCTTKGPKKRIPYRDSHLTSILMDSLGGNSKTFMLVTVSPHSDNAEETLQTLKYGAKARQIVNTLHVNENAAGRMLLDLEDELKRMRQELERADADEAESEAVEELQAQIHQHEETMRAMAAEVTEQQRKIAELQALTGRQEKQRQAKAYSNIAAVAKIESRKSEVAVAEQSLRRQVSSLNKNMTSLAKQRNDIETEIEETLTRTDELETKKLKVDAEVDAIRRRATRLESARWDLQKRIEEVKHASLKQADDRVGALLRYRLRIARARLAFERRQAEKDREHAAAVDNLRASLQEGEETQEFEYKMRAADLENERENLRHDVKGLRQELDRVEGERQREVEALEERAAALQAENKKRKEAMALRVNGMTSTWDRRYGVMVTTMQRQYGELMDECRRRQVDVEEEQEARLHAIETRNAAEVRRLEDEWRARVEAAAQDGARALDDGRRQWERQLADKRAAMAAERAKLRAIAAEEAEFSAYFRRTGAALEVVPRPAKPSPTAAPTSPQASLRALHDLAALFHGQYEEDRPNMKRLHQLLEHDTNSNRCDDAPTVGLVHNPPRASQLASVTPMRARTPSQPTGAAEQAASPSPPGSVGRARRNSLRRPSAGSPQRRGTSVDGGNSLSPNGSPRSLRDGSPNAGGALNAPGQVNRRSTTPVRTALFFSTRVRTKSPARTTSA